MCKNSIEERTQEYFVFVVWEWWDCIRGLYIWNWVSEDIPCFTFIDFYVLLGKRDNLCDCAGYVEVIIKTRFQGFGSLPLCSYNHCGT